jgi:hypothetical protein
MRFIFHLQIDHLCLSIYRISLLIIYFHKIYCFFTQILFLIILNFNHLFLRLKNIKNHWFYCKFYNLISHFTQFIYYYHIKILLLNHFFNCIYHFMISKYINNLTLIKSVQFNLLFF